MREAFLRGDWFYLNWTVDCPTLAKARINLQETHTVLVALQRWKQDISGKWFTVRTENVTAVNVTNKGMSRNLQVTQWSCKVLALSEAQFSVNSCENTIADALLRLQDPSNSTRFLSCVDNLEESNDHQLHMPNNAFASLTP